MNVSAEITGDPAWGAFQQGQVFIRGSGDHGNDFEEQEAQVIGGTSPASSSCAMTPMTQPASPRLRRSVSP